MQRECVAKTWSGGIANRKKQVEEGDGAGRCSLGTDQGSTLINLGAGQLQLISHNALKVLRAQLRPFKYQARCT